MPRWHLHRRALRAHAGETPALPRAAATDPPHRSPSNEKGRHRRPPKPAPPSTPPAPTAQRSRSEDSRRKRPGHTEAGDVEPVTGDEPDAERRAEDPREVALGLAAENTDGVTLAVIPPGAPISRRAGVVHVPAVLNPFPNVPVNVEQTEAVRRKTPHRSRTNIVPAAPAIGAVRAVPTDIVAPPIPRHRPRARNILPLRLAQQTIRLPRLTRKPLHVRTCILPAHANRRVRIRLRKTRIPPTPNPTKLLGRQPGPAKIPHRMARRRHETTELAARNLVNPDRKRRPDRHTMPGTLVAIPALLRSRRTHHETPRWNNDHLGATHTIPENFPHLASLRKRILRNAGRRRKRHDENDKRLECPFRNELSDFSRL